MTLQMLDDLGMKGTKILAKIETRQSLLEFRHILKYSDGIILSRGNMGLDIPPEKMCLVQKTIISACNMVGKPAFITRVVRAPTCNAVQCCSAALACLAKLPAAGRHGGVCVWAYCALK